MLPGPRTKRTIDMADMSVGSGANTAGITNQMDTSASAAADTANSVNISDNQAMLDQLAAASNLNIQTTMATQMISLHQGVCTSIEHAIKWQ